jgi:hypothetical protein
MSARVLAGRLGSLFATDQQIVSQLNDAQRRLRAANDRLSAGRPLDLGAVHWQIHSAFCAYQHASEQRRQLAVDVGELSQQLTDVLQAAGWSIEQARAANVHHLATAPGHPARQHARTRSQG